MFFTFSFLKEFRVWFCTKEFFLYGINTHFKNIFFHTSKLININISVSIPLTHTWLKIKLNIICIVYSLEGNEGACKVETRQDVTTFYSLFLFVVFIVVLFFGILQTTCLKSSQLNSIKRF